MANTRLCILSAVTLLCLSASADSWCRVEAEKLLLRWCDALESYQVKTPEDPRVKGALLCPACAIQHGRICDVVYPMVYLWTRTSEPKYLNCAVDAVKWSRHNLTDHGGVRLHNDFQNDWWGISVFSQIAIGKTLLHFGDKLPKKTRDDWMSWFESQSDFVRKELDIEGNFNVNYSAALCEAMALAWKLMDEDRYLALARKWARIVLSFGMPDGMLAGEKHPPTFVSPHGYRSVDIGYNAEESLPSLYHYAELTGDRECAAKLDKMGRGILEFVLPDGGIDNSMGSRLCKWTYYGSRTSDGALPLFAAMAKRGIPGSVRAIGRHLTLLERCTSKMSGLLAGGLYYDEADEGACVHHSFAHAKALVDLLLSDAPEQALDEKLPRETRYGIREFPSFGTTLVSVGPWRVSFSVNDAHHNSLGTMNGGGSMTLLYHEEAGLICAGTMARYSTIERENMQIQRRDCVTRCMTPRIEWKDRSSVEDADAVGLVSMTNGTAVFVATGAQFKQRTEIADAGVRIRATAQGPWRYVFPVIATAADEVKAGGKETVVRRKDGGTVRIVSSHPLRLMGTDRGERAFTPIAGLITAYLATDDLGDEAELVLDVSIVEGSSTHAFSGTWITDSEMAVQVPRPYESRQLQRNGLPPVNASLQNRHILFRRSFELKSARDVRVFVTADDYYKLYVNGMFAGQGPAAGTPEHTYYNEIDISRLVRPGRNVIAVHTYYQGLVNRVWVSGDNRHGLILDVEADGRLVLGSDERFRVARHRAYSSMGVVGYDTQFLERYDARAAEVGFEQPDFPDADWQCASVHPRGSDYGLFPQPTPMLVCEDIHPVKTEELPGGVWRFDFGGVYVGAVVFAAQGPRGAEIGVACGQELDSNGSVRHGMRCNCDYVESFVLSGRGRDVLNPFEYKSFRYCELKVPTGVRIDRESVVLKARHMPFALVAKPKPDADPRMDDIWRLCVDTFRYGVQEQIQDCMDREKGYYLGDGCYTMLTYCRLTGDWSGARRFIDDFLRTSTIDRGLMTCGCCAFMQEIAEYPLMFIWFVRQYLEQTGDAGFVRDRFARFADILDCYRERYARSDGLLSNLDKWCVVEWPKNFQDGYDANIDEGKVCTATHNAINAWYVGAVKELNAVAQRVGLPVYADVHPLEESFRKAFYDSKRHLFVDRVGSVHVSMPGNVYAAFFGLEPADDHDAHHAAFVDLVRGKRFSSIGLFQFFPLFSWLRDQGEVPLMRELILSPDAWLRNIREGATRTFEGWGRDTKWNASLFHLTIASVAWFLM